MLKTNVVTESALGHRGGLLGVALTIPLAGGIGLGLSSLLYFLLLVLGGQSLPGLPLLVLILPMAVLGVAIAKSADDLTPSQAPYHLPVWLALSCAVTLGCALTAFAVLSLIEPRGHWDAWMIWNLRATQIFRGGEYWRDAFQAPIHPDYPWLLPALVALGWRTTGSEMTVVPVFVAAFFTFATVLVLHSALALWRSATQAALASVVLLGTIVFVIEGPKQYADVPLGFFFLTTLALLTRYEAGRRDRSLLVLAGMTTGLATWTKNEGLLFALAVIATRAILVTWRTGVRSYLREALYFAIGLLPILVCFVYFKVVFAPPSLVAAQGTQATLAKLQTPARYFVVAKAFKDAFVEWSGNNVLAPFWALGVYAICVGFREQVGRNLGVVTVAVVLGVMLTGYSLAYLTTPYKLELQINSSLDRLLLQLWPSALFGYFWVTRTPENSA